VEFALFSKRIVKPAGIVTADRDQDVRDTVLKWSEDVIEQPHEMFGGLPICPFARAARLKETIRFEIRSFAMDDPLDAGSSLFALVSEFTEQTKSSDLETLFVIHPDRAQRLQDLEALVQRLNACMADGALQGFLAFEAHPDSNFRVGNVYTRRSPFPSFQVLSRELLKKGSDSLLGSPYYAQFTPEMLRAVGMPR
jgi:hypothetical protein